MLVQVPGLRSSLRPEIGRFVTDAARLDLSGAVPFTLRRYISVSA
jgi:hypothetical protein